MRRIDQPQAVFAAARSLRAAARTCTALALFVLVLICVAGVAHLDLNEPLHYDGDSLETLAYFDHDYIYNDFDTRLHAPFELEHKQQGHYLFNALFQSNSNLIWLSWLAAGADDVRALNLAYLATFLLAFLSAYWVCGRLGLDNPFRFCAASMYALMPYHFGRGVDHFWESSYYLIPLLALLVIQLWSARPWAQRWDGGWKFSFLDSRTICALALIVFLSSFHPYPQFFFVCLAGSVAPLAALYRRSWKPLAAGWTMAAVALAVLVLKDVITRHMVSPELALAINGQAIGGYGGAESYPLKLAQLVLPVSGHRWHLFAELRAVYDKGNPLNNENGTTTLGLVGACGMLACLLLALVPQPKLRMSRLGKMGLIIWIAIAFAMMGGLSSLVSTASLVLFGPHFSLTQMRGWNRIVVFIAFFAYFAAFYLLRDGLKALQKRYLPSVPLLVVAWPAAALVLAFAIWDAVPNAISQVAPTNYLSDRKFFSEIEADLPAQARILQLPYLIHHASGWLEGIYYTDALRPYINTKTLHFTYGGDTDSEQAQWLKATTDLSADNAAPLLCSYAFSGVLLQRNMVKDAAAIERPWTSVLNAPPRQSEDGNYSFYDLRPFCAAHHVGVIDMAKARARTLAERDAGIHTFSATRQSRQIGRLEFDGNGEISVVADANEEGFLAYGPFEDLPDGHYTATFSLAIDDVAGTTAPCLFNVAQGPDAVGLAEMAHRGSTDGITQFRVQFATSNSRMLQYRVFKPRGYIVKLIAVRVADDNGGDPGTATRNRP